ncbi:uncharacterized protein BXZ73DRAFT_104891 [Epithele typhae]|uniref:uncharacterized protein n=1 Tax=Epithele typhae TaxID=378194 RepID=UPI002008484D|nr:uncharacterized protein BXZ73DRAFT_104891 [Epithele typhae]KAH9919784.1 hypothetical protein BXZ73DRAFT_104891 [Epithele typhae]
MSTENLGNQISQVIGESQHIYAENYVSVAATVILIFDHLLTFGREVDFFWNRRVSGPTLLFILNRYLPLMSKISSSLEFHPFPDQLDVYQIISPGQFSLIGNISDPITTILVSRFLLDLQEVHQGAAKLGSDDPLHSSASDFQFGIGSLRFAVDAMGSIGADLRSLEESHISGNNSWAMEDAGSAE